MNIITFLICFSFLMISFLWFAKGLMNKYYFTFDGVCGVCGKKQRMGYELVDGDQYYCLWCTLKGKGELRK